MSIPFNFSHLGIQHKSQLIRTNTPSEKAVSIQGRDYKIQQEDENISLILRSHIASLESSKFESVSSFEASLKSIGNIDKLDSVFQKTMIAEQNNDKTIEPLESTVGLSSPYSLSITMKKSLFSLIN